MSKEITSYIMAWSRVVLSNRWRAWPTPLVIFKHITRSLNWVRTPATNTLRWPCTIRTLDKETAVVALIWSIKANLWDPLSATAVEWVEEETLSGKIPHCAIPTKRSYKCATLTIILGRIASITAFSLCSLFASTPRIILSLSHITARSQHTHR